MAKPVLKLTAVEIGLAIFQLFNLYRSFYLIVHVKVSTMKGEGIAFPILLLKVYKQVVKGFSLVFFEMYTL